MIENPSAMRTKKIARKHHYLPQDYLAGFTDSGTKDGRFFVLEVETGNSFITSPKNVAAERDFNRVEIDGKDPDVLEQALAPFEEGAAKSIRRVEATGVFPSEEDFSYLINLLCLIAVRNPHFRKSANRSREQVVRHIAELLVSDKKVWEHNVEKAKDAGKYMPSNVSFEDVKRFVQEGEYRIEFGAEGNIRTEFHVFNSLLPILGKRLWSLFIVPEKLPEFVCSDRPVTLVWKNPNLKGRPIGYGLRHTEVFFPLNHRRALFGVFEDPLPAIVILDETMVAEMNARVAQNAERQVFSACETFMMVYEGKVREVKCHRDTVE
jgi:hypothetical protein